jgi:phosphatidate cytidylyltransferase
LLKQRVITALILLAVLLPALFYSSPDPFCALLLLFIAAAGWEWACLNGLAGWRAWLSAAFCLALCLLAWAGGYLSQPLPIVWLMAAASWVLLGVCLLRLGVNGWPAIPRWLRLVAGIFALVLAWLAVSQARRIGINFLLSVLLLVWGADIFAYFAGRAFGLRFTRYKLAPSISPGKSWEGVWGGMIGVTMMAFIWVWFDQDQAVVIHSLFTRMASHGALFMVLAVLFMVAMSVVGDLVESLIKRSAGVKDSSGLLPGHGGVLDRIDALLPALPLAMMLNSYL